MLMWDQLQLWVQSGPLPPHRNRKERLSFRRTAFGTPTHPSALAQAHAGSVETAGTG